MADLTIEAAREFSDRWLRARQMTSWGPDLDRPTPVLQYQPEAFDMRPVAPGRDPCRRCNTRGDIGCAHQRPCEAFVGDIVPPGEREGRRRYDRRSMGVGA